MLKWEVYFMDTYSQLQLLRRKEHPYIQTDCSYYTLKKICQFENTMLKESKEPQQFDVETKNCAVSSL